MRVVYFIIAWISLALGLIGIVLPVLTDDTVSTANSGLFFKEFYSV